MSAVTAFFGVLMFGMILMAIVMILGLRTSRQFKASAKIGKGSFDIETMR